MSAQKPDKIIIDEKIYNVNYTYIIPTDDILQIDEESIFTTACYRGYIATWQIENDKVYLVKVFGKYKMLIKEKIFASWLHTPLKINLTNEYLGHHISKPFCQISSKELFLNVSAGEIKNKELINNC